MFRKLLHLPFCLVILLTLVGCGGGSSDGGGGGDNPPTSANVRAAGQQIVDDTKAVEANILELTKENGQITNLANKTTAEIGNNFGYCGLALDIIWERALEPLLNHTVTLAPGQPTGDGWTTDYILQSTSNGNNVVNFLTTNPGYDPNLIYSGTITYPSNYSTTQTGAISVNQAFPIRMEDSHLKNSTFYGNITITNEGSGYKDVFSGDFYSAFKNDNNSGNYLKLHGDITFPENYREAQSSFSGSIETADLNISGSFSLNCITKTDPEDSFHTISAPKEFVLQGSISNKAGNTLKLNGYLSYKAPNADTYDFFKAVSADNYLKVSYDFRGSIQNGSNIVQGSFYTERKTFDQTYFKISYELKGQVNRSCTLAVDYDDSAQSFHLVIDSTWGPATLIINGIYNQNDSINGEVDVNGTKVGTLKYDSEVGGIKISYNDGSFETL